MRFSALQRAEIAEMSTGRPGPARVLRSFSALQRAEIAEIARLAVAVR